MAKLSETEFAGLIDRLGEGLANMAEPEGRLVAEWVALSDSQWTFTAAAMRDGLTRIESFAEKAGHRYRIFDLGAADA